MFEVEPTPYYYLSRRKMRSHFPKTANLSHLLRRFLASISPIRLILAFVTVALAVLVYQSSLQHSETAVPGGDGASPLQSFTRSVASNLSDLFSRRILFSPNLSRWSIANMISLGPGLAVLDGRTTTVPSAYPPLEELEYLFVDLVRQYPNLVTIQKIGTSTAWQQPIYGIRISNESKENDDEPAVLFSSLHHAREPVGVFICKAIMQELLSNYGTSPSHTRLVDSLEIWLVPIVNPDGYRYLMENQRNFPWWRKNLRDNNNDGRFDPMVDGVDLNRNYDYNWGDGGDGNPGSWFYRGSQAFSEMEIQAIRDLALRRNFVMGVSYHSYGEAILYPWANYHRPPDQDLILDVARQCAKQITQLSGKGSYHVLPLNGRVGQSSIWMYGELGAIDFICETGDDYFANPEDIPHIVQQNVRGAMHLMERALRSGIHGHVVDAETRQPLSAEIHVRGYETTYVRPRHSSGTTGSYDRLLLPGSYVVEVAKPGYETARLEQVLVQEQGRTLLDVELRRMAVEDVTSGGN